MNYTIFLDDKKIGITKLEKSDVPMGVAFGNIAFETQNFNHQFFSDYCKRNLIKVTESGESKFILTPAIPGLKVYKENGKEIESLSCSLGGSDNEGYEIYVTGIPFPFYEQEFPHHVKEYNDRLD